MSQACNQVSKAKGSGGKNGGGRHKNDCRGTLMNAKGENRNQSDSG